MNEMSGTAIPVETTVAAGLTDARRLTAVGRLVDRLVQPGSDDPLIAPFERISDEARETGLSESEIEAEWAVYNAERRV